MKLKQLGKDFAKGTVIGGSMLLPGVSGGTCAIIIGIYDRLIKAVSTLFKSFRENTVFLLSVALGGRVGVLGFSWVLSAAMERWGFYLSFLFMGAVLGTVPIIYRQASQKSQTAGFKLSDVLYTVIGVALSLGITLIPENLLNIEQISGAADIMLLFAAGAGIAVALVLPGISVSYTLLILGIYDRVLVAVKTFDFAYILPISAGCIFGIFAVTKLLDYLMNRYTRAVYMIIGGFVLSSVPQIFPGLPVGFGIAIGLLLFIAGFFCIFMLSRRAEVSAD